MKSSEIFVSKSKRLNKSRPENERIELFFFLKFGSKNRFGMKILEKKKRIDNQSWNIPSLMRLNSFDKQIEFFSPKKRYRLSNDLVKTK